MDGEADLRAEPAMTGAEKNFVQANVASGLERSDINIRSRQNPHPEKCTAQYGSGGSAPVLRMYRTAEKSRH